MKDFIIIGGSPGVGKSTIARLLRDKLDSPWIDFGKLREFHLDREWKKADSTEEEMTFENALFMLKNYAGHGYKNVIIDDLKDDKIERMPSELKDHEYVIITLFISDKDLLAERIKDRNEGFTDVLAAQEWNDRVMKRNSLPNEYKFDRISDTPEMTLEKILAHLK